MHRRKETHTKIAYFSFRCMTLVQRKGTGKGILDWGQTLQGLKKKNRQPQKSITVSSLLCGITHKMMMLNRNAKENVRDDNSFGRLLRMIHIAQDYDCRI